MTPEGIGWVELTDHLVEDKLPHLPAGVDRNLIIGRLKNHHGDIYEDKQKGGYNMYLNDYSIAIGFVMQYQAQKAAVVKTAFPCTERRFEGDRWEPWP